MPLQAVGAGAETPGQPLLTCLSLTAWESCLLRPHRAVRGGHRACAEAKSHRLTEGWDRVDLMAATGTILMVP